MSFITISARKKIALLHPTGLGFESYEIGVFFTELLKNFSQEKGEEIWKQEYLARNKERKKDPRKYYTEKMRLWV